MQINLSLKQVNMFSEVEAEVFFGFFCRSHLMDLSVEKTGSYVAA